MAGSDLAGSSTTAADVAGVGLADLAGLRPEEPRVPVPAATAVTGPTEQPPPTTQGRGEAHPIPAFLRAFCSTTITAARAATALTVGIPQTLQATARGVGLHRITQAARTTVRPEAGGWL